MGVVFNSCETGTICSSICNEKREKFLFILLARKQSCYQVNFIAYYFWYYKFFGAFLISEVHSNVDVYLTTNLGFIIATKLGTRRRPPSILSNSMVARKNPIYA